MASHLCNHLSVSDYLFWLQQMVDRDLGDDARLLWLKVRFLEVFLSCEEKHNNIENRRFQKLLLHIRTVFQSVDLDIRRCCADFTNISSKAESLNRYDLLFGVQQRLGLLKPDIHEVYTILSKSSRSTLSEFYSIRIRVFYAILSKSSSSTLHGVSKAAMNNLQCLQQDVSGLLTNNAEMVAPLKEELEAAQKSLEFLSDLIGFTGKRSSKMVKLKDIIIHAEFLMDKMSCLLYMCSSNEKMNDSMVNEMKMHFSSELQNFSPAQRHVRQMYIKALKDSKSPQGDAAVVDEFVLDELVLDFLYSLRDNILQISDTKFSFTASYKGQILSLYEDLQFLTTNFARHTLYQISKYFFKCINSAIVDMGCLIYSLHGNDPDTDETEVKRTVSDLRDIIEIAKEGCRKAYDTYISKWHMKTKFQTTSASGIRSLMRILEKIKCHSFRCSRRLWHHHFDLPKVFEKEMQSLIGTFISLTAKQQLENGELEFQMKRLNHIKNEFENLFSSVVDHELHPDGNHKLWLYMLIQEIKMIRKEFNYLQNQMMHDTSTSKPPRRINRQRKKTITDSAEISEDEPKRKGKPHSLPVNVGMRGIENNNSNLDLISPQKNEVRDVILKLGFLKVFLGCKGMWHIEETNNLKILLTRIHRVFQNADLDLQRLWKVLNIKTSPKEVPCLPKNMDCQLSRVLSMLQHLYPDIEGAYAILLKSSSVIFGIGYEALMENFNSLLKNIEVMLECNTELVMPLKEELEAVQKSLRFWRNFLGFTTKRCCKLGKLKDLLIHSEFLACKISCFLYVCFDNENMNDQMVNKMKMHLSFELQRFRPTQPDVREIYIKALKASKSAKENSNSIVLDEFLSGFLDSLRDNILELSNNNLSFLASTQEQVLSLQEELKFLISFFTVDRYLEEHSKEDQVFNSLFVHLNDVVIDIGCIIHMLNNDENNEVMAKELDKNVSDLVANFMAAKEDIRKIYDLYVPKQLPSDFPRTNGQGYLGSFFQNLNELLQNNLDLIAPLKYHIEIVQKELLSLREDFGTIAEQPSQCYELESQWNRFLDTAYQTEFIIDLFVFGGDPIYCHKLALYIVVEEIKTIKIDLKAIKIKMTPETSMLKPSCLSTQVSVESNFPKTNAVMSSQERLVDEMTFEEAAEKIQEKLTRGSKKLHVISIVGMPGIGKTTLADLVFQQSSVTFHFHVRARCSVSQVHNKSRLLLEILQEVKQYCDDDDDDADQKLYQSLKGMRYLILLDDLWDIQPWENIKALFPDDENGSRIIFTSRFDDIASQAGLESSNFRLSPLPKEKSWEMLKVKLFGNQSCPSELVRDGHEIATNCKGLPLTIDLVAGVLRMKERKEWKKVAQSLMTTLFEDPQRRCRKVLELSYQNLPNDLKPCFLYFAMLPEDANVPTRDLILLWIAEGFVQLRKDELKSIEDVAKDILDNLINRNLVTVSKRGPLGGVTESRVHDLLHEFAIAKAQEESFMLKLPSTGVHDQWQEQYRACIYPGYFRQIPKSKPFGPRTRTLICNFVPRHDFSTFKLLRVLYISSVKYHYCPEMFTLIHLRLLAFSGVLDLDVRNIIQNIHKLKNLETFVMSTGYFGNKANEKLLLDEMCNMGKLRHFCFDDGYIHIRYLREEIWQKASFANLQTFYNLKVSYEEDIEKILKLMPNLVELKILFKDPDGGYSPVHKLDFLMKLESLEVTHSWQYPPCSCKIIGFPPNLKRLVLSNFGVPWTQISQIGKLQCLEVLELRDQGFRGPIWQMINGQFPKLKYLSLSNLDIEEWNASEDHLSCLEQLHVTNCRKLKDLPPCLIDIAKLQAIKLFHCNKHVEDSAKRIKEEQEQMGNDQLVVAINGVPN